MEKTARTRQTQAAVAKILPYRLVLTLRLSTRDRATVGPWTRFRGVTGLL